MPNHIHGILLIEGAGEMPLRCLVPARGTAVGSLSAIVQTFKAVSTRRVNLADRTLRAPLWQRNYYEHVIRNERDLQEKREYILDNPVRWELDKENPFRG